MAQTSSRGFKQWGRLALAGLLAFSCTGAAITAAAAVTLADATIAEAATQGWRKSGSRWWYQYANGTYAKGWAKIGGTWYHFDNSGWMQTGWLEDDDIWYYFNSNGDMVTGWQKIGGAWYYFSNSGAMKTGWLWNDPYWYYLNPVNGAMTVGTKTIDGVDYRFRGSGELMASKGLAALKKTIDAVPGGNQVKFRGGILSSNTMEKLDRDFALFQNQGYACSFVLIDLMTGATISANPYQDMNGASTIKAPYCCAILKAHPVRAMQYTSNMKQALINSSNETYENLRQIFGSAPMQSFMDEVGVGHISASISFVRNMRAVDLAKLWVGIYEHIGNNGTGSSQLMSYLSQSVNSTVREYNGTRWPLYTKPGWYPNVWGGWPKSALNDAGIVMYGDHPAVFAILTSCTIDNRTLLGRLSVDLLAAHRELVANGPL